MGRPDITMIRVKRVTVAKLKRIGRKSDSYTDIIERLIEKTGGNSEG